MARKQGSHSDITGPRLRKAALRLIAQHGYAAVSMRQIASDVGVQAGTLYNYTEGKQSLLFDLMRSHMEDLLAALAEAQVDGSSIEDVCPRVQLDAFVRFHIQWHLPRRDAVFVSYMELRNLDPNNYSKIARLRRQYELVLEEILQAGQGAGMFKIHDARMATMALISMLTGVANWYREEGRLAPEELVEIYVALAQNAVGVTHIQGGKSRNDDE